MGMLDYNWVVKEFGPFAIEYLLVKPLKSLKTM